MTRHASIPAIALLAAICLVLLAPFVHAQSGNTKGKKEYVFTGSVERVDAKAKTLTVNGDKVEGWMAAMTMMYRVDDPAVVDRLKAGDRITAKVYGGDFEKLYQVRVVPPAPKK